MPYGKVANVLERETDCWAVIQKPGTVIFRIQRRMFCKGIETRNRLLGGDSLADLVVLDTEVDDRGVLRQRVACKASTTTTPPPPPQHAAYMLSTRTPPPPPPVRHWFRIDGQSAVVFNSQKCGLKRRMRQRVSKPKGWTRWRTAAVLYIIRNKVTYRAASSWCIRAHTPPSGAI